MNVWFFDKYQENIRLLPDRFSEVVPAGHETYSYLTSVVIQNKIGESGPLKSYVKHLIFFNWFS